MKGIDSGTKLEKLLEAQLRSWPDHGRYRHDSIPEVVKEVYGNPDFMARYMRGRLVSQLFWNNHFSVIHYYANTHLPSNRLHYSHLEIGPGHGLLLCFAARDPRCASAAGWDISPTSLELTRRNLSVLGITRREAIGLKSVEEFISLLESKVK